MTSKIQGHLPNLSGIVVATAIYLLVGSVATHMVLEERLELEWKRLIAWRRRKIQGARYIFFHPWNACYASWSMEESGLRSILLSTQKVWLSALLFMTVLISVQRRSSI